jgi:hypothetical protein
MNPETTQHNTQSKKTTKTRNSNWEEAVADRLEQFASKDDVYILEEFYLNERIPAQTFYDGVGRNQRLKEAHTFAITKLGINREKLALKNREGLNSANVAMLPVYLERWAKYKEHAEGREDKKNLGIKEALGNITIVDHMLEGKE